MGFLSGIGNWFQNANDSGAFAAAGAALDGDYAGMARIRAAAEDARRERDKDARAAAMLEGAKQAAIRMGYTEDQTRVLMLHPESLANLVQESLKTRQGGAEGMTIDTVDPKTMKHSTRTTAGWHEGNYYGESDGTNVPNRIYQGEKVMPVVPGGYLGVYGGPQGQPQQPQQQAPQPQPGQNDAQSLMGPLSWVESRNRPGALGPMTKYGQAQGATQMLPATAHAMADKLHLPWQPQMMTGTSPEAAQYQQQLGQAYLQEGLDKTGNPRDALRYYHGGPNQALWGPKTNAYADQVLARAQGAQNAPQAAPQQQASNVPQSREAILAEASAAIQRGADPKQVAERLRQMGIQ